MLFLIVTTNSSVGYCGLFGSIGVPPTKTQLVNSEINPKIKTDVNEWNYNEILADKLAELNIDKWKILCQKP